MKPLFVVFLGIIAIFLTTYMIPSFHQIAVQLLSYSQCDTPLQYKIGSIDPRFGLNYGDALQDSTKATEIWRQAVGKNLLEYSDTALVTVNFVYDQRQALDTQINELNSSLKQSSQTLQQQVSDYHTQVAAFKARLNAFENTVNTYNQQGGAPASVYDSLITQQNQLKIEGEALNEQARQLNLSTSEYNAGVSVLHEDINQFNTVLAKKPEEGLYNGANNTITLYFANNHQELLHTLAHEFGHALGIGHVKDPTAIMYPYSTSSLMLTSDDLQQLHYICREQSSLVHWFYVFDDWYISKLHALKQYISK